MHALTRRGVLRTLAALPIALTCASWHPAGSTAAEANRVRQRNMERLQIDALLDEAGFSGPLSKLDTPSPYADDHTVWERILIHQRADAITPDRSQPDGSKAARITHPDPVAVFTGDEGVLLASITITSGPEVGLLIGNRGEGKEFGERTIGLSVRDGNVQLVVIEGETRPRGYNRPVGSSGTENVVLGFAFAEAGRRIGAFTNAGDVIWADDYPPEPKAFDPSRPTNLLVWSRNTDASAGTTIAYQPKTV